MTVGAVSRSGSGLSATRVSEEGRHGDRQGHGLSFLRDHGKDREASQAEQELPDTVATDRDSGLLERFGIDVGSLVQRFTGGMDLSGV